MGSIIRKFKDRTEKRTLMVRNGATVLKELIASSHGKYNPYRIFSAKELEIATNYDKREVIHDNFYKLYKGFWQERLISVVKFGEFSPDIYYEYSINNIVYAAQMDHKHILKLIGCCLDTPIPVPVFESVEYGTLCERIFGAPQPHFEPLLLKHRLKIAVDIAHALAYLHFGFPRPIVFRNFKTSNILFNEENAAKLFDFSLSISIPKGETHITTSRIIGPWGCCAPEHKGTGGFNEKSDVFSFGVFLFELLTGRNFWDLFKDIDDPIISLNEYLKNNFEGNRFTEIVAPIIVQCEHMAASRSCASRCLNSKLVGTRFEFKRRKFGSSP